ncbi:MAG: mercury(II) reductase [Actinobacteria bacterium]|nr:mercury(II) reductase [Actinomycetota bacterium]
MRPSYPLTFQLAGRCSVADGADRFWRCQVQRMRIQGMTCEGCNEAVAEALVVAGATEVRADFKTGQATFSPGAASEASLRGALEQAGYRVAQIEDAADPVTGPDHRSGPAPRAGYDLLVVGSGAAAFAAGIRARDLGASVALCEANSIGGTCVNIGCVPSKAMLAAADAYHRAGHSPFVGVRTSSGPLDLASLVRAKDEFVDELRAGKYENIAQEYGFTLLCGRGRFTGPGTFVCEGKVIRADRFLIATGASPSVPPVPGLEEAGYLTSTTALELKELPESIAVIGANSIGLEMGQLFLHLGSRVTFLEALPRVTPFEEPEISDALATVLRDEGADIRAGVGISRVERAGKRRAVVFEQDGSEERVETERILVATGRRPNTAGLGLEATGVELTDRGAVRVDEFLGTTNPRIWAAGDVTGAPQFVYVAATQGSVAADNAIGKTRRIMDWTGLPRVTFTSPQIASVGMTASEAANAGHRVESRTLDLAAVPRALVNRDTRGLVKLVADAESGRLLGMHVLAESAGEVILAGVYAVKNAMTITEIAETWAPYLTMAEGIKLAAQTFTRDVSKLSCCAA